MYRKIKKCPAAMQYGLGHIFAQWGAIVARCSIMVFIVSLSLFLYLASGVRYAGFYDALKDAPYAPEVSIKFLI